MIRAYLRNLVQGPIATQLRRFAAVGTVAAGTQLFLLWSLVEFGGMNYLLAAAIAIEVTILLQYLLNNYWTFAALQNEGRSAFLTGLFKTNVVRGTAIPIQLGILYALVTWGSISYLVANAIAILLSGIYRFTFDLRWTWGAT
ncbi:MAG: GtrA family protein [Halanaeroarchaeum sp.]